MAELDLNKKLICTIVTPERALLEREADFVAVPMYDGELGVLPNRAPLVGRLGTGELRIRDGKEVLRYFVDGGFVQIREDKDQKLVVSVLTSRAQKAEDIDLETAKQALESAKKRSAPTEAEQNARHAAQERARAQIRLATRVGKA